MSRPEHMSRRQVLGTLTTLSAVVTASAASAQPKPMTFLLVHGAWHGGWCLKKLTPLLRVAGHQVFAPTLTGLGERSHLLSPAVALTTHIKVITAVLEYEDLQDVVLVGHSYGGMVIAGVAALATTRLAHPIYLDAFLPEDGKAVKDYAPLSPTGADDWRVPVPGKPHVSESPPRETSPGWKLDSETIRTRLLRSRSDWPVTRMAHCGRALFNVRKLQFFSEAAQQAKRQGFRSRELFEAGHDAMITRPKALAKMLLDLV